jgi:hypothetical protein
MEQPPNCKECGEPLREYAYSQFPPNYLPGNERYGWAGCGYFCTKDCAAYWAVSKARKEARVCNQQ